MKRRVNLFGDFYVEDEEGTKLAVNGRQAVVLAYLLLLDKPVPRSELADALWPNALRESRNRNMRKVLYRLEQQLGQGLILREGNEVGLIDRELFWVDVWSYREEDRLLTYVWNSAEYETAEITTRAESLLNLQTSPLLQKITSSQAGQLITWFESERDRLQESQLTWLHRLVTLYSAAPDLIASNEVAQLERYIDRGLELAPFDETLVLSRLKLLARQGHIADALAEAKRFRERLSNAFEDDVSPSFLQYLEQLASQTAESLPLPQSALGANQTQPVVDVDYSNRLIGRDNVIEKVTKLVLSGSQRMLSLIGLGGIGKTALARHVYNTLHDTFENGTYFVDLTRIHEDETSTVKDKRAALANAILTAYGLQALSAEMDEQDALISTLMNNHSLIIIDNFETVVEASDLISAVVRASPRIVFLITSRERLARREEYVIPVTGLSVRERMQTRGGEASDAAKQFARFASQHIHDFELTGQNLSAVERVCEFVDGIPLALELIASWLPLYDVDTIIAQLERDGVLPQPVLAARSAGFPARQQSMEQIIQTSWEKLSSDEQSCLAKLSLFHGEFTTSAAIAVSENAPFHLSALLNRALITNSRAGHFRIHPLIREFGNRQLLSKPALVAAAEQAYARHIFSQFDDVTFSANVSDTGYVPRMIALHEDIVAAFKLAVEHKMTPLLCEGIMAFSDHWTYYGALSTGFSLLEDLLLKIEQAAWLDREDNDLHDRLMVRTQLSVAYLTEMLRMPDRQMKAVQYVDKHRNLLANPNFVLVVDTYLLEQKTIALTSNDDLPERRKLFRQGAELCQHAIELGNLFFTNALLGILSFLTNDFELQQALVALIDDILKQISHLDVSKQTIRYVEAAAARIALGRGEWAKSEMLTKDFVYSAQHECSNLAVAITLLNVKAYSLGAVGNYREAYRVLMLAVRMLQRRNVQPFDELNITLVRLAIMLEDVSAIQYHCKSLEDQSSLLHTRSIYGTYAQGMFVIGNIPAAYSSFLTAVTRLLEAPEPMSCSDCLMGLIQTEIGEQITSQHFDDVVAACAFGHEVTPFARLKAQDLAEERGLQNEPGQVLLPYADLLRPFAPLLEAKVAMVTA